MSKRILDFQDKSENFEAEREANDRVQDEWNKRHPLDREKELKRLQKLDREKQYE